LATPFFFKYTLVLGFIAEIILGRMLVGAAMAHYVGMCRAVLIARQVREGQQLLGILL